MNPTAVEGQQTFHSFPSIGSQKQLHRRLLTTVYIKEATPALEEPEVRGNGTGFLATGFIAHLLWTALHAVSMELLLLWGQ